MGKMGRFVVETHGHITTLYDSVGDNPLPRGGQVCQCSQAAVSVSMLMI